MKRFKATTIKTFVIAISIYIVGLLAFVYIQHDLRKKVEINKIDLELRKTAALVRSEISDKLHVDITGNSPITASEDEALADKLTEISANKQLEYVYSIIQRDEKIFFTSSSKTEEEISGQSSYKYTFLLPYEDASSAVFDVFSSGKPAFAEYKDQWGYFRTFFQPVFNGPDISYVIGADISIDKVNQSIFHSSLISLGFGLFLGAIAFPMMLQFFRSVRKEHEAEKIILFTDSKTGLDNFNKLSEDIKAQSNLKLALIEIDNYTAILNAIGPAKIEHVTTQFINRIRFFIDAGEYDMWLYSISPRKFGLLTTMDLSIINTKIINSLFQNLVKIGYGVISNNDIRLSVRIGAAANEESLFVLANMALDKAKDDNKSIVFFTDSNDLPEIYTNNIKQTSIFHQALDDGRVKAFFQPIVDAKTAQIAKFECLARIVDEDGNVIQNPEEFMPIAYNSRLCHKVTRLMLDQSLKAIKDTQYCISINLSISDLFDHATMKYICFHLDKSKLGKQIEFEILEHENIRDYNKAAGLILQLKKRGCRIGMDDLGKHYSNFDRLAKLPLDFVKIDGSIVSFIEDNETALAAVINIVHLAKSRDLDIVAEYCINEKVYDAIVKLGIGYLQGFFIGMPSSNIQEIIRNHDNVKPQLIRLCPVLDHSRTIESELNT